MKTRLLLAMLLVVMATITSILIFGQATAAREVYSFMFRGGMAGVDSLVSSLENYYAANQSWRGVQQVMLTGDGPRGMMRGLPGMRSGMDAMHPDAILTDLDGNVIAQTGPTTTVQSLSPADLEAAIPLRRNGNVIGYLSTGSGVKFVPGSERPLVLRLNQMTWYAALIGAAIAVLLSFILGSWFLKPIHQLTKAAVALGKGDLNQRVQTKGKDEVAQLAASFNQMAESLQSAEQNRKAMTADIAHELRTPLAVQRANLEAIEDGVYPLTAENLKPILEQNLLLSHLVEDLRILALADAGELRLDKVETDLGKLIQRVAVRFEPQTIDQHISIKSILPDDPILLEIDPMRIEEVLTNLISNAIRFTPQGGVIQVILEQSDNQVLIRVIDSGPGIPEDELPRIFDRFYRVDKARARDLGGSGLGLAISRQLARAHGGDITAQNASSGGAEFSLQLPA